MTVAALYVEHGGTYYGLDGVEPWGLPEKDAREYAGPHPVVAHPPCERWGRWWWAKGDEKPGNDGGCFAAAASSARSFGGVIEHPKGSHAWRAFDWPTPSLEAWTRCFDGGWTTCVAQRNYGHRAEKLTWLYVHGVRGCDLPELDWSKPAPPAAYLCRPGRRGPDRPGRDVERMGAAEAAATPIPFRDLLLSIARSARRAAA